MFRKKRRKGQAIVEMALVFPFFLLIIVGGVIDFGFAFYNYLTLQQIANDTAQWAADNGTGTSFPSTPEINNYANLKRPSWWTGVFTVQPPKITTLLTGGQTISILVTYESPTYTPFYQTIMSATSGSSSIRLAALAAYKKPEFVVTRN